MILAGYAWLARTMRRQGVGASLMGPLDEVWNAAAHRVRVEIEPLSEAAVPSPSPEDLARRVRQRPARPSAPAVHQCGA